MRDISDRLKRYRLGRYASPGDSAHHRLRWAWAVAALWLVWVGFVSEHNFYRLWQLGQEDARNRQEAGRLAAEGTQLERQASDPKQRRRAAEEYLRGVGMAQPGEIVYRRR